MVYNQERMRGPRWLFLPNLVFIFGCAPGVHSIPESWLSSPPAPVISSDALQRTLSTAVALGPPPVTTETGVRIIRDGAGSRLFRGDQPLTPVYLEIESFDVSLDRREVVFS